MSNGKGPVKALTDDKKTQKELRAAASSLRDAMSFHPVMSIDEVLDLALEPAPNTVAV